MSAARRVPLRNVERSDAKNEYRPDPFTAEVEQYTSDEIGLHAARPKSHAAAAIVAGGRFSTHADKLRNEMDVLRYTPGRITKIIHGELKEDPGYFVHMLNDYGTVHIHPKSGNALHTSMRPFEFAVSMGHSKLLQEWFLAMRTLPLRDSHHRIIVNSTNCTRDEVQRARSEREAYVELHTNFMTKSTWRLPPLRNGAHAFNTVSGISVQDYAYFSRHRNLIDFLLQQQLVWRPYPILLNRWVRWEQNVLRAGNGESFTPGIPTSGRRNAARISDYITTQLYRTFLTDMLTVTEAKDLVGSLIPVLQEARELGSFRLWIAALENETIGPMLIAHEQLPISVFVLDHLRMVNYIQLSEPLMRQLQQRVDAMPDTERSLAEERSLTRGQSPTDILSPQSSESAAATHEEHEMGSVDDIDPADFL